MLARNPTILIVNDTLFAHGGVLPEHGEYIFGCYSLIMNAGAVESSGGERTGNGASGKE